jgi:hypothetical protein
MKKERSKIKPGDVIDKKSSPMARGQKASKKEYMMIIHQHRNNSAIKFKRWLSNVLWQLATPSLFPNRTVEDILKACKDKLFVGIFLEGLSISQLYWLLLLRFESLIL